MVRAISYSIAAVALTFLVLGCGSELGNIETSVRDEMKSQMKVEVKSLDLKKQAGGGYAGSATATNGDAYDVTVAPPKDNKFEWKAVHGQALVEKAVRDGLTTQLKTEVKSLELKKTSPGHYTGPAEMATGERVIVTTYMDGAQLKWEAKPATP